MKKMLALLLVLCMIVGLVACGGKKDGPSANNPSTGNNNTTPSGAADDPQLTVTPETSPYNGKTLQIWGLLKDKYSDYSKFGKGNYLWMEVAAVEEWAAMNGVKIEYVGSYNQAQMLAGVQAGDHPDLVFQSNKFPAMATVGLSDAFTDEEYAKLAAVCDSRYLDLMNFKGASHGVLRPWVGNMLLYYNKTMFENYGVKTPKEYFMEGNWTWTTMAECMEAMTKDVNADGVIDTYGLPNDSKSMNHQGSYEDENGRLHSYVDSQYAYDFLNWVYNQKVVKQTILTPGSNQIQKKVQYPMYAMQVSDCEPYNFEHLYQTIPNGDELEVVPCPRYDGTDPENRDYLKHTQSAISLLKACDEREAAVDLIAYLLKCGLKYMSDFSLGDYKCDYVGMQGKCELSQTWKEYFGKVCEDRAEAIKEIENYDKELISKMYEYFETCAWTMYKNYPNVKGMTKFEEAFTLPPSSSLPSIKPKVEASYKAYNDLYIDVITSE